MLSTIRPCMCATEKVGAEECHVLELTAKRKGATYQRILYWVRAEDARPVRAEFYLTSGKHISPPPLMNMVLSGGKMLLRRLTLYDEIRHNSHSVLEYSGRGAARSAGQALLPGPRGQVLAMELGALHLRLALIVSGRAWRWPQGRMRREESPLRTRYSVQCIDDATFYGDLREPLSRSPESGAGGAAPWVFADPQSAGSSRPSLIGLARRRIPTPARNCA